MNKNQIIKSMQYINGDPAILPYSRTTRTEKNPGIAMGQIKINTPFGNEINKLAKNTNYNTYLDIGSWCGLGTTKCLLDGIILRDDTSVLYSLESNRGFYNITNNYWSKYFEIYKINTDKFILKYGSLVSFEQLDSNYITDSGHTKNTYDYNLDIKSAPIIKIDTPIDVLCLDGGHFSTILEWNMYKNSIKVIILDDTKTSKTRKILDEIKYSNKWNIIYESDNRNGELIATKIN